MTNRINLRMVKRYLTVLCGIVHRFDFRMRQNSSQYMELAMMKTDQRSFASDYAPYEAFWEGFVDYQYGLQRNPYDAVPRQNTEAQAWDFGREASMRVTCAMGRV